MTADRIIANAKKEIGTKENPSGSNRVKYNTDYYGKPVTGSAYPWCCTFVWWVFREAGASDLFFGGKKTAYCPTLLNDYKKKGQTVASGYKPGDIVFFNFSGGSTAQHVGICTAWDGTSITTIDGNTGTDNESNGGAVMLRKRNKKYIVGVARPAYQSDKKMYDIKVPLLKAGSSGDDVKAVQVLLKAAGHDPKGADGKWGANTTSAMKAFQKAAGLDSDGICGPASWTRLLGV